MKVFVTIEPEYQNTIWCKQTIEGINNKLSKLRYVLSFISDDNITPEVKLVIVIGTSPNWVSKTIKVLAKHNAKAIVVSCQPEETLINTSYILIDHADATSKCIQYLQSNGRENIALYGINQSSYADNIKSKFFFTEDIYINHGDLTECYTSFKTNSKNYDAVICANYITAISLIKHLQKDHISVPTQMFIMTFGDSLIGQLFSPSLTTVTLNHIQLGEQAVSIYSYLLKQNSDISITVKIPCEIIIQESTDNAKNISKEKTVTTLQNDDSKFYNDPILSEIMKIETLLTESEPIDFKILEGIANAVPYSVLSEKLYTSENAIKYRVKRLLKISGINTKESLVSLLSTYFDVNKLGCSLLI